MTTLDHELAEAKPTRDTYLTIGVFDGVHVGHQHLLQLLKDRAALVRCASGVVTFRNHPRSVLSPGSPMPLLTPIAERVRLLRELGIEVIAPVTFTLEVSQIPAREFVGLLQSRLRMRGLVIGPDFALGHNREGTLDVLQEMGRGMGFAVTVATPYLQAGQRVSSTAIRQAVAEGDVTDAARCLGRYYALTGVVVRGEGRGGPDLGFPTANLQPDADAVLPADGIYVAWAHVGERRYGSAVSVGVRPTFGQGNARTVEAFLLDFRGDLYGQTVRLEFVQRLRPEKAFAGIEALKLQISLDVEEARRVLGV
ncbi:MAG: bifunctional riboflavin kinase/FAD synthetase [Chloroflexi bacterium]|nr:bifunctional riboflavin kinase/FAD synthetase [Chloroflexota bacterium]